MAKTHYFPKDKVHYVWDKSIEPVLEVDPGDTVVYETRDVTDAQIDVASTHDAIGALDFERLYPLAGPVFIKGVEPGDMVKIEIRDVQGRGWGWSGILPGFGLLPEEFSDPYLAHWHSPDNDYVYFKDRIRVPVRPFAGTMGLALAEEGQHDVMPPRRVGGNMDIRWLTKGATLYLPAEVEGGLFSIGDGHLAQGDGEVCVTAVEGPIYEVLRFDVVKDHEIAGPRYETPGYGGHEYYDDGFFATTGISTDLWDACQKATREMVQLLSHRLDLSPVDAYLVASVAVDLKVNEVVDKPNWTVSALVPKAIFL